MNTKQNQSDEEIVISVISGKSELYGELMERYEKKLARYVRSIVGSSHDIDDIVQTVFIKTYRNLTAYDRTLKFSSWIYRIAHNESVNHLKSSFIQKVVAMGEWFDYGVADTTEDDMDRELLKKQLTSCLDGLDVKYREPIVLYYFEDKTYEDISDIVRIPVRAVGVRIFRGKELMRRLCHEKITR
jgi:RNA polymerase sigma-70 factor (ECF subfamily)